jgi:CheY-like chemotaxis protein
VFCVDDQARFRDLLRELVEATPGLTHVGEAGCGREAIDSVKALRPDLVLMDVSMPGIDGFEAARALVESRRNLVVVLISAGPLEPPPGFAPRGGEITLVHKEELSPRRLLDIWHGRRTR